MHASPTISRTTKPPRLDRNVNKTSWKPRQRGDIFCSPACGGGCTKEAHDAAHRKAKALAHRLGPGWKPRVWENLGWHYSVEAADRRLQVHEARHGRTLSYTAYFNPEADSDGGKWVATATTPVAAIRKVMEDAQQVVILYTQGLIKVCEALAPKKKPAKKKRAKK